MSVATSRITKKRKGYLQKRYVETLEIVGAIKRALETMPEDKILLSKLKRYQDFQGAIEYELRKKRKKF